MTMRPDEPSPRIPITQRRIGGSSRFGTPLSQETIVGKPEANLASLLTTLGREFSLAPSKAVDIKIAIATWTKNLPNTDAAFLAAEEMVKTYGLAPSLSDLWRWNDLRPESS